METTQPRLPARYYAVLASRLVAWGVSLPELLRDAGIDPQALASPQAELTLEQADRLVALALQRSGHTDLGFELGRLFKLSSHDILGYAMLSAPTVDQALRLVSRYFRLITPAYALRYHSDARQAEARLQVLLPLSPAVRAAHLEAIVVAFYEHVRMLASGEAPECRIELPFEAPPHAARYRELAAARVSFGHPGGARIVLPREVVMRAQMLAEDNALHMAERRCAILLARLTAGVRFSDWVRGLLRDAGQGQPALGEIAAMLNLSPRTLERRLRAEGSGFRELARRARFEAACAMLLSGRMSVTQVALELGYTDLANFTRAFRRESGVAPSAYRLAGSGGESAGEPGVGSGGAAGEEP